MRRYLWLAMLVPGALSAQAGGEIVATDERPRPVLAALEVREEIRLDGILDEAVWRRGQPATDFVQAEPREGTAATEKTEVWVAYDESNLYIAAYLYDSEPDKLVVTDIRKDFGENTQDAFSVILDTFSDRRNGYVFSTNPEGARADQQVASEGREVNRSWDAIWSVETQRRPDGWSVEMRIPFRALRFDLEAVERWGLNFSRNIRRKNEVAYWSPIPRAYSLTRLSLAGTLVGLQPTGAGRDLRVKPYVLGGTVREPGGTDFDGQREIGLDIKYGLTPGLTLDVTANPDFAQVEQDEQRVNFTQFSLFFPEKREFFLENSGVFYVGDAARNLRVRQAPTPDEDLLLFFSRRIGLNEANQAVPIQGGVRLSGQAGGLVVGGLAMRTSTFEGAPENDYAVVRLRKNVLSSSDIGGIFMMRDAVGAEDDYNRVYGLDSYIRFPEEIDWSAYFVRTESPGAPDGQYAFRTSLNREGNFNHIKLGVMEIGEGFTNDLGYFRRTGIRKYFIDWGVRPRPESFRSRGVREIHPHIVWNYYDDLDGRIVAKRFHSGVTFFFNGGGNTQLAVNNNTERIESDFQLDPRIDPIPAGSYNWDELVWTFSTNPSRPVSTSIRATVGELWTGTQKAAQLTLNFQPSYNLQASLSLSRTNADMDELGEFTRTLWTFRPNYSFHRNMFVDALIQYDPDREQLNSNVRFRLIHRPLSDLYLVWNEQRFTTGDGIPPGRSFQVKVTQMVAF
jgi:hypothetical protein